jgi:hypothetical protein
VVVILLELHHSPHLLGERFSEHAPEVLWLERWDHVLTPYQQVANDELTPAEAVTRVRGSVSGTVCERYIRRLESDVEMLRGSGVRISGEGRWTAEIAGGYREADEYFASAMTEIARSGLSDAALTALFRHALLDQRWQRIRESRIWECWIDLTLKHVDCNVMIIIGQAHHALACRFAKHLRANGRRATVIGQNAGPELVSSRLLNEVLSLHRFWYGDLAELLAKAWFEDILAAIYRIESFPMEFCEVVGAIVGRVTLGDVRAFARGMLPRIATSLDDARNGSQVTSGDGPLLNYVLASVAVEWAIENGKLSDSEARYFAPRPA